MARADKTVKLIVFIASLLPLVWLVRLAAYGSLGANPIEKIERHTGDWTLNFIMITLAISPLQKLTGWKYIGTLRKMLGLYAFFYASLHLMAYIGLDQFFAWDFILKDMVKQKRIILGMASYALLVPLAVTSSNRLINRLSMDRWKALHRLIYVTATGGVIHYLWLVKKDLRTPLIYASILAVLFALRGAELLSRRRRID